MTPHGIDFVDEDDAWRIFLGFGKHVTHAARADADEHLDKVGTRNREKRNACFSRDCAGEQSLAGAWATDQQSALWNFTAEAGKFRRVLQKVDDFLQFVTRFINTCDIVKSDFAFLGGQHFRARLPKAHRAATGVLLHLAHHENSKPDHQDERQGLI